MYDNVLLPTDGTPAMEAVIEHARNVTNQQDGCVHVLYVIDDRAFLTLDDERIPDVADSLREEGVSAVGTATEALANEDFDVTTEIREGDPADEILAAADEHDADLVVMGTHGADPTRNLLGSVSRKVVTLSSTPVLTIDVAEREASESSVRVAAGAETRN
ncbi:universal stress protein [Halorussus halophilus]|uniref:universal stress protein n=1 Tax=Halorussus halophilus TaxID=2650975 RepID=UPI0013017E8D|nr:universal stress protein [Halorussus halophilus]